MPLLVPDVGEVELLRAGLGRVAMGATDTLKLYTNNITPGESDTAGTYTEAAGFGYAAKSITNATDWTVTTTAGTTEAVAPQQTWTFTGALGNVYGYYIIRADTGVLLWAERFTDGPYNIANNGDEIRVTPKIQLA